MHENSAPAQPDWCDGASASKTNSRVLSACYVLATVVCGQWQNRVSEPIQVVLACCEFERRKREGCHLMLNIEIPCWLIAIGA